MILTQDPETPSPFSVSTSNIPRHKYTEYLNMHDPKCVHFERTGIMDLLSILACSKRINNIQFENTFRTYLTSRSEQM